MQKINGLKLKIAPMIIRKYKATVGLKLIEQLSSLGQDLILDKLTC